MSDDRDERMWKKVLNRLDDLERLIIQSHRRIKQAMSQLDTDIKTLATSFAQATADQQLLLTSLTNAINNSTADDPTDDPTVQGIITAMQTNHQSVVDTLANLGVSIPAPTPAAQAAAVAK